MRQTIEIEFDCSICSKHISTEVSRNEVIELVTEERGGSSVPILADDSEDRIAECLPDVPPDVSIYIILTIMNVLSNVDGTISMGERVRNMLESEAEEARCPECGEPINEDNIEVDVEE